MDRELLAYLSGTMDSDGFFSIRRSTYRMRVKHDAVNAIYAERVGLKQITQTIPDLLRECFGGHRYVSKPQTKNSHPLECWQATHLNAYRTCVALLPFLRIKSQQADLLIELHGTRNKKLSMVSYWFAREFPEWSSMELITTEEASILMKYKSVLMVSQAIRHGTLLALPYTHHGVFKPRIPRLLVERIVQHMIGKGGRMAQASELVALRESLYQQIRELNKIGLNGTPVYHRTGPYTQK
jgi:hypothetical protein